MCVQGVPRIVRGIYPVGLMVWTPVYLSQKILRLKRVVGMMNSCPLKCSQHRQEELGRSWIYFTSRWFIQPNRDVCLCCACQKAVATQLRCMTPPCPRWWTSFSSTSSLKTSLVRLNDRLVCVCVCTDQCGWVFFSDWFFPQKELIHFIRFFCVRITVGKAIQGLKITKKPNFQKIPK